MYIGAFLNSATEDALIIDEDASEMIGNLHQLSCPQRFVCGSKATVRQAIKQQSPYRRRRAALRGSEVNLQGRNLLIRRRIQMFAMDRIRQIQCDDLLTIIQVLHPSAVRPRSH